MKWRNQMLALACLVVFFALGVLYFKNWVVQKPFGIILFIGEGLDPARLAATRIYAADARTPLSLDALSNIALLKNYSADSITPDAAAAATALATGVKVNNGTLGVTANGKSLVNLLELARQNGRVTGLLTDARLTDPTLAAFYAHKNSTVDRASLARELVGNAFIDVVLGGGAADFLPQSKGGTRADERDLTAELQEAGYEVVHTADELEDVPRWRRPKLFGLFGSDELAFADDDVAHASQPTLADMVRRGIELLQFNRGGYVLVVDAGLAQRAARQNDGDHTLLETIEFDRAVAVAVEYAGNKSMIIVCGDVALGGIQLNGSAPSEASGGIWWGSDPSEGLSLTWATGPHGPTPSQTPDAATLAGVAAETTTAAPEVLLEPAAVYAQTAREAAADVLALGRGPGTDALQGIIESTRIFEIIEDNL
ncbi:MAG TPA: alkaline phosphatase [Chthoniobacterales bacterium]|jgi:alkaline phosphatase